MTQTNQQSNNVWVDFNESKKSNNDNINLSLPNPLGLSKIIIKIFAYTN